MIPVIYVLTFVRKNDPKGQELEYVKHGTLPVVTFGDGTISIHIGSLLFYLIELELTDGSKPATLHVQLDGDEPIGEDTVAILVKEGWLEGHT